MDTVCEYFKIEEKKYQGNLYDRNSSHRFSQIFLSGKCTNEKFSDQAVSCYGMKELCKLPDVGEKV